MNLKHKSIILGLKRVDFDHLTAFTSITIFVMIKKIYNLDVFLWNQDDLVVMQMVIINAGHF